MAEKITKISDTQLEVETTDVYTKTVSKERLEERKAQLIEDKTRIESDIAKIDEQLNYFKEEVK